MRARVAHRKRARRDVAADFFGQLQQPQVVRDRRAILADLRRDVVLLQMEFIDEPLIRGGRFHRIEIFALDVFDQRHLEQPLVLRCGTSLTTIGTLVQLGELRGAPAPLAGDDLVALASACGRGRRVCARRSAE